MKRALANTPMADIQHDPKLGSVPATIKNISRRHDWFVEVTKGKPVSWAHGMFFDPFSVELFVLDPACIRHFLKDNSTNYTKPPTSRDFLWANLRSWLGTGIFAARHGPDAEDGGHSWSRQRKVAAAIFTRANFNNNMSEIFVKKARHFCDLMESSAKGGEPIDMQLKFFSYTMDSIMEIFFGEVSDTLSGQDNAYATAFDTAHRGIYTFITGNMPFLAMMSIIPWPLGTNTGILKRIRALRDPRHQMFREANATLTRESLRLVKQARSDPKMAGRKDLLALFLQAEEQEQTGFADEWIRDVVLNFILAGRDTTACALSWMFYILATHPEIQEKVCKEIDEKLPADADVNFKAVGDRELPYLHGVLYETLRLYPPVPYNSKEAVADDVLPDGTKVPAHAKLRYLPYAMGRDPQRYPDPLVIKPERWIPFKEPLPHEFPVFQAGPRICLGLNMAIFEAKILAGILLRRFTFEISATEAENITYLPTALTMSICNSKSHDSHKLLLTPKIRPSSK